MSISPERRTVAKTILDGFQGTPRVFAFQDEKQKISIDLLACGDQPQQDVTSYATIGLFEHSIGYEMDGKDLRLELFGVCQSSVDVFANMLVTSAFHMIQSGEIASYGAVFKDNVKMYLPESKMKHILFLPPSAWTHVFEALELGNRMVAWLQAVPISEAEYQFLLSHEVEELEALFEEKRIDLSDLQRNSVV